MALPGTTLANTVLKAIRMDRKPIRKFTYVRAQDRSYKLWGSFTDVEANRLRRALETAGALNARVVYVYNHYLRCRVATGVRFEMPEAA